MKNFRLGLKKITESYIPFFRCYERKDDIHIFSLLYSNFWKGKVIFFLHNESQQSIRPEFLDKEFSGMKKKMIKFS